MIDLPFLLPFFFDLHSILNFFPRSKSVFSVCLRISRLGKLSLRLISEFQIVLNDGDLERKSQHITIL